MLKMIQLIKNNKTHLSKNNKVEKNKRKRINAKREKQARINIIDKAEKANKIKQRKLKVFLYFNPPRFNIYEKKEIKTFKYRYIKKVKTKIKGKKKVFKTNIGIINKQKLLYIKFKNIFSPKTLGENVFLSVIKGLKKNFIYPEKVILTAIKKLIPGIGLITQIRAGKPILYPAYLAENAGNHYAIKWLYNAVILNASRGFVITKLVTELMNTISEHGLAFQAKFDFIKSLKASRENLYVKKKKNQFVREKYLHNQKWSIKRRQWEFPYNVKAPLKKLIIIQKRKKNFKRRYFFKVLKQAKKRNWRYIRNKFPIRLRLNFLRRKLKAFTQLKKLKKNKASIKNKKRIKRIVYKIHRALKHLTNPKSHNNLLASIMDNTFFSMLAKDLKEQKANKFIQRTKIINNHNSKQLNNKHFQQYPGRHRFDTRPQNYQINFKQNGKHRFDVRSQNYQINSRRNNKHRFDTRPQNYQINSKRNNNFRLRPKHKESFQKNNLHFKHTTLNIKNNNLIYEPFNSPKINNNTYLNEVHKNSLNNKKITTTTIVKSNDLTNNFIDNTKYLIENPNIQNNYSHKPYNNRTSNHRFNTRPYNKQKFDTKL